MKKKVFLACIAICILLIAGGIITVLRQPNPQKLVVLGLERLSEADSFSYIITQNQWVDGKSRLLARITGEKGGENIHIQGQLAGSEVEMFKIGNTLYNKDPFSKEWVKFSDISVVQEVFLVELNPLTTLQLKEMGEVMLRGQEEVDGKKCWVCYLKPSVQNQIIERFWSDFEYTLYISKVNKTVVKAEIKAKNKESNEPMTISLEFKDIGRRISIQPPEVGRQ